MAADIPSEVTIFKNVNIFGGKSEELLQGQDVLVVGNPVEDISLLGDAETNPKVIMKDGKVYKNTLD